MNKKNTVIYILIAIVISNYYISYLYSYSFYFILLGELTFWKIVFNAYKVTEIILYRFSITYHHFNYFKIIILKINKFIIHNGLWLNNCVKQNYIVTA